MLIDCDTCTVRGEGCADCVVTVLLGAPPGWQEEGPRVVPLTRRPRAEGGVAGGRAARGPTAGRTDAPDAPGQGLAPCDVDHVDNGDPSAWPVVELDDVERRAVSALAEFGLVPPLRHQDASAPLTTRHTDGDRHVS